MTELISPVGEEKDSVSIPQDTTVSEMKIEESMLGEEDKKRRQQYPDSLKRLRLLLLMNPGNNRKQSRSQLKRIK